MYVSMTCPSDILRGERQAHVQGKRKRCSTVITQSLSKDLAVFIQANVKKSTIKIYIYAREKVGGGKQHSLHAPHSKKWGQLPPFPFPRPWFAVYACSDV